MTDTLKAGESLVPGGPTLVSNNQKYFLVMQSDGNLVMYYNPNGPAIWNTGTWGQSIARAFLQDDGNFVLYRPDNMPVWATGTSNPPHPNSRLVMQDDRNLVIYDQNGKPTWASNSWVDPNAPISVHKEGDVGNAKYMSTDATLYRNGYLTLSTYSRSQHWTEGLRGHVLVVCVDAAGRAIWVSQDFQCTTRCSIWDFTCASAGTDTFNQSFPNEVGQFTERLDIYHSDEGLGNFRGNLVNAIKTAKDIAPEIIAIVGLLS